MSCTIYSLLLVQVTNARMYLLCWLLLWSVGSLSFNILRLQSLQGRKANIALFSTSTTSTTSSSTLENKVQLPKVHTCPSCHDQFDSRNKLYKHLRQSEEADRSHQEIQINTCLKLSCCGIVCVLVKMASSTLKLGSTIYKYLNAPPEAASPQNEANGLFCSMDKGCLQ